MKRGRAQCLMGLALALGGLAATRLGWLWIEFDVFAQFTLQFALATVAFLAGYFMPRARMLAAVSLIITGLIGISLWPHVAASRQPPPLALSAGETSVKLMTFNTWYENTRVEDIGAELMRVDADIVFLAELAPNKRKLIASLKTRWPFSADCFDNDPCNLAILSKFPILNSEGKPLWKGPPYVRVTFGPELGGLVVTGTHTIRFPHQRAQATQLKELAALVNSGADGPQVVMGDFNTTAFSRMMHRFVEATGLTRLTIQPTWPARLQLPQLGIDHIFVSSGIRPLTPPAIGRNAGSDHFPVAVTVAVKAEP